MDLTGEPRAWLLNLPGSTVASWGELRDLFTARYVVSAHHAVAALLGSSRAPPSDHHVKLFLRQIGVASKRPGALPGWAAPEADLTFSSEDHPDSTTGSGMLPMLCTPTICNVAVAKTLVNGGAGLNLLSVEALSLLHVPLERLSLSKPFSGVGGGTASSLGQIRLPITFGTRDNYRTELMPGSKGVLTIKGDAKEALAVLGLALKTATAAQPADAGTSEAKGAVPTKKKKLFTQDKAETKQPPLPPPLCFSSCSPALSHDLPLSLFFISYRSPSPWSTLAGAPSKPRWPDPARKQADPFILGELRLPFPSLRRAPSSLSSCPASASSRSSLCALKTSKPPPALTRCFEDEDAQRPAPESLLLLDPAASLRASSGVDPVGAPQLAAMTTVGDASPALLASGSSRLAGLRLPAMLPVLRPSPCRYAAVARPSVPVAAASRSSAWAGLDLCFFAAQQDIETQPLHQPVSSPNGPRPNDRSLQVPMLPSR
ncbi:uncharacterized protein LOC119272475 [Triticum dicoccoides]|uniref:uncharacterized protein LOC119272475 n=1 Tax=Triticum dicoccoides TaxID=85692 RepID=UPI00188F4642|nr:uncharacterized protein LOC119272475 [Triticum dicoccoides]